MTSLYVALIHYPVVNKNGKEIASAITNLDLHDIARAARTFGVKAFYVATPLDDQRALAERIVSYWVDGAGGEYNPNRLDALDLIHVTSSLEEAVADIRDRCGEKPVTVVTCARQGFQTLGYPAMREKLGSGRPYLLVFGTAWGLSEGVLSEADYVLDPIVGNTDYNHLSVRSAAAIILDRLMGDSVI